MEIGAFCLIMWLACVFAISLNLIYERVFLPRQRARRRRAPYVFPRGTIVRRRR